MISGVRKVIMITRLIRVIRVIMISGVIRVITTTRAIRVIKV